MASQSLEDRCLQVVQDLAHEKRWQLPPEGIEALVEAILPFVRRASGSDDWTIRKIALNYYLDGLAVQQMLAQGAPEGEQLWEEWRKYFVSQARWACSKGVFPEDVEDLAQEVYIQAHKALHTFRFESRLKAFFRGVFSYRYKQWIRDTKRIQDEEQPPIEGEGVHGEAPELAFPDDKSPLPEAAVIKQEQNAEMIELVEEEIGGILDSVDFQILYWYYIEETYIDQETGKEKKWTDKAIGERLGMPRNTVTSRRRRALQRLNDNPRLRSAWRELGGPDTEDTDE